MTDFQHTRTVNAQWLRDLSDPRLWVQDRAIEEVVRQNMTVAIPTLLQIAANPDRDSMIRGHAVDALAKLGGTEIAESLLSILLAPEPDYPLSLRIARVIGALGNQNLVAGLIETMQAGISPQSEYAIYALGALRNTQAILPLTQMLNSTNSILIKEEIINVLSKIGDDTALPALLECLHDAHPRIRWLTANSLRHFSTELSREPLLATFESDSEVNVRASALITLAISGDTTIIPIALERLQHDSDAMIRAMAAEALGILRARHALPALLQAWKHDHAQVGMDEPTVSEAAAEAIVTIQGNRRKPRHQVTADLDNTSNNT